MLPRLYGEPSKANNQVGVLRKIVLYFGPKRAFMKLLPTEEPWTSLTSLALRSDARQREHVFKIQARKPAESPTSEMLTLPAGNVVALSDEYAVISESAIQGFLAFLSQFEIDTLYLQNPPAYLASQFTSLDVELEVEEYDYRTVDETVLSRLDAEYEQRIFGQPEVREALLTALLPLARGDRAKPVTLLFYGPTGSGKTETAKLIGELVGQPIFRKQFSMFHSGEFASYLFGGRHSQICLAKELMERESNILLFDEFDKPNPVFHSAFYQLFDEGIYCDRNYRTEVRAAVIVCTTNYESAEDAARHLGLPLFARFDAVIRFAKLSAEANRAIVRHEYAEQIAALPPHEREAVQGARILETLLNDAGTLYSARHVKRAVQDAISAVLLARLRTGWRAASAEEPGRRKVTPIK
ncbi:AAA family ATPase [Oleispirillum naphthae]|uniref:AAA family ATPase n=1 Tax=Oleispirillum naphthae TaxID=2838853 RepID=UPI00308249FD